MKYQQFCRICLIFLLPTLGDSARYERNDVITDVTCASSDVLFSDTAHSIIGCLAMCDAVSGCYSIFYTSGTTSCVGCNAVNESNAVLLPSQPGALHYSKPVPVCAEGWDFYNGTNACYKLEVTALARADAVTNCNGSYAGSHLVDIKTEGEMNFIRQLYTSSSSGGTTRVWIGAYTSSPQGPESYLWTDGTRMVDGFNNFLYTYTRSCVFFDPTRDFVWENAPCYFIYWSVCEYDI